MAVAPFCDESHQALSKPFDLTPAHRTCQGKYFGVRESRRGMQQKAGNKDERGELENWFAILSPMGEAGAGEHFWGKPECSDFSKGSGTKNINY